MHRASPLVKPISPIIHASHLTKDTHGLPRSANESRCSPAATMGRPKSSRCKHCRYYHDRHHTRHHAHPCTRTSRSSRSTVYVLSVRMSRVVRLPPRPYPGIRIVASAADHSTAHPLPRPLSFSVFLCVASSAQQLIRGEIGFYRDFYRDPLMIVHRRFSRPHNHKRTRRVL